MDESAALDTTAARAVETADRDRVLWTDADREWASRAAAAIVGERASAAEFLGRRAQLVLERIGTRQPAVTRTVRGIRWRPWVGVVTVVGAFVFGVLIDRIGGGTSINLLAPPVFALVVWNLVVYVWLLVRPLVLRGGAAGPLRASLIRIAAVRGGGESSRADAATAARRTVLAALPREWARIAAPLYGARAARVLHVAAAATALGVIAGLYTRGLAFEYRASWESTFLGAEQVHALLSVTLAPGSWLTGIPVPDVAAIEAIRAPASENAAMWMHLMAGTVAVVVIIPRLVLAIVTGLVERRRAKNVPPPLDEPYYRRLVAGWVGEPTRVRVIPYSYTLTPEARAGLEAILARAYGNAAATIDAPVGWGDDEWLSPATDAAGTPEIRMPLFSLTATPEDVAHGAFLATLGAGGRAAASGPTVVLVDESAFLARWDDDAARREERRAVWRELIEAHGGVAVFVDLAEPDLAAAEAQLADAASAHNGDAKPDARRT
ncbi:DUF2868 domain-containing protein [Agromyces sp. Soil535]|uniref:DUF2868 domain-containing protein n=1 Tax=Agromyces sp. Soil535 TaxID=1736390 RepID=UPI0006F974A8|nr:DUF2868 domain-containing protein [Agromyces sp. Soil535]KRE21874.1 hypothetical protein ASG80_12410 [Agromyces sp. Soil535]